MNGYEGMCMSRGKFLKPWQVTDKIIEWIFSQFTFNILWVTLTQKIITHRLSKIHEWFWGDVYSWIFETLWVIIFWVRVTHKMLNVNWEKIHSIILSVTCHGLRNFPLLIHIPSKPWAGESFLSHDKWEIKLLSEFFSKFTFNILWVTLTQKIITHRVSTIHDWFYWDVCQSGEVS